ncbi:hypothetical protein ACWGRV_41200 [Streptomyces sp. NPDC055663]
MELLRIGMTVSEVTQALLDMKMTAAIFNNGGHVNYSPTLSQCLTRAGNMHLETLILGRVVN